MANAAATESYGLGLQAVAPGEAPLHVLPEHDEETAREVAELLLEFGADPARRNEHGETPADKMRARGFADLADLLEGR